MVTIQESELKERGLLAVKRAKILDRPILISEVRHIDPVDPLFFYHIGKENYLGERFFWKDPDDKTFLVGLGIAKQIESDQTAGRFSYVEKMWQEFLTDSLIYNSYRESGIGPVLFGGFSFDPKKEKTGLWSKYADSLFHIPKYLLSQINGKTFITTNIVCTPNDDVSLFLKTAEERHKLLYSLHHPVHPLLPRLLETKEIAPEKWKKTVDEVVGDLTAGSLKKVVLARELRLHFEDTVEAEAVLEELLKQQHSSFIFSLEANGDCFIGASPERLVKKEGNDVFSTCLAGSTPRGKTDEEDKLLGDQLLNDQKNLIEHRFVVEMIRKAFEEYCEQIMIPDRPQLMKIRDIQHLYTPVTGKCKNDTSLLRFVERLHPTPALGGLPKKQAVEKIRQVEELDRGFYAGPLGWLDYHQNGEFAVSIRSALIQQDEASLFAGCGIVADSNSESEYLETSLKFTPMLRALGGK